MLFKSFLILIIVRISLSVVSLKIFKKIIQKLTPSNGVKDFQPFITAIKKWGNKFPNIFTCLVQAATLRILLGKQRDNTIHFGVKNKKQLEAHAWLEYKGKVLMGEEHFREYKKIWSW